MSDYTTTFTPAPAPAAPKKKRAWKLPVIAGVAALLIGISIGGANTPEPETVTVEKIVEKPTTVTKEVKVPTTPASCLTALTLSEQAFDYAAEALGYSNDALQAAGRLSATGIEAASAKMNVLNPKMAALAPRVNAAKAECRASAK